MNENELRQNKTYKTESGTEFMLILPYSPNEKCFRRMFDGSLHYGREFIGYANGKRIIELSQAVMP